MKYLFALCTAFFALSSLAQPLQGGVSGGGGNIIFPQPVIYPTDPEVAEHIVFNSYDVFLKYVQQKKLAYQKGELTEDQLNAFSPIFKSAQSIESVISQVRLHVVDDHSCWDAQQNPVDGSTITPYQSTVCISAYNIANKTALADIAPQSAALMLHEYSELVGLDEDQAVRAQTAALKDLRGF